MKKYNKELVKLEEFEYTERDSAGCLIFIISYPKKKRLKLHDEFDNIEIGYATTHLNRQKVKYKIDMCQLDKNTFTHLKEILLKHMQFIFIRTPLW